MNVNKFPYWTKGVFVSIILYFVMFLTFGEFHRETFFTYLDFNGAILMLIIFILSGAIIGWAYGKLFSKAVNEHFKSS